MSSPPVRFKIGLLDCLLVPARDVRRIASRDEAAAFLRGCDVPEDEIEGLIEGLADGSLVPVRLGREPALMDAPEIRPLVEPTRPTEDEQRSWVSIEVIHAAGLDTAGIEVELDPASGAEVFGRLGEGGRWRADGIARGSCRLSLLDHAVLRARPRIMGDVGSVSDQELWWEAGTTRNLELSTAAHHRIRIITPRVLHFSV
ncbi:MAG: hypothetical protein AAF799_06720 [Myxococcota bacterium]